MELLERIIDGFHESPGRGLPIGSLTSQHFANFYLGFFDRLCEESLRGKGYVRYMDDMVLWCDSAARLKAWLSDAEGFLADELRLAVKPRPYINRTERGMDVLGCRVFRGHMTLNRKRVPRPW